MTPTPQQIIELALNTGFSYDPRTNHLVAVDGYTEVTVTPGLKRFATLLLERYGQAKEVQQCPHGVTDGNCKECYQDSLMQQHADLSAEIDAMVAQEPVAWMYDWLAPGHDKPVCDWISQDKDEVFDQRNGYFNIRPLYTHPAPAEVREPLTREQVKRMWREFSPLIGGIFDLVAAVEKHHGITGSKA